MGFMGLRSNVRPAQTRSAARCIPSQALDSKHFACMEARSAKCLTLMPGCVRASRTRGGVGKIGVDGWPLLIEKATIRLKAVVDLQVARSDEGHLHLRVPKKQICQLLHKNWGPAEARDIGGDGSWR
jgi:hypothetical protein